MKQSKPLEPETENSSLNSEIEAATEIQSSVRPEDYPLDQRARIDPARKGGPSKRKG
ncbi:hypothetical protein ACOYW6_13175 [Parablastomonas sp. CN1-191]|uniref:hypothetical protein n=1 Tax=Parablastomonas sp. CN1-191 TaxID=3400908 RepID=UPI003BF89A36